MNLCPLLNFFTLLSFLLVADISSPIVSFIIIYIQLHMCVLPSSFFFLHLIIFITASKRFCLLNFFSLSSLFFLADITVFHLLFHSLFSFFFTFVTVISIPSFIVDIIITLIPFYYAEIKLHNFNGS